MELYSLLRQLHPLLVKLRQIDFGYPLGDNFVRAAQEPTVVANKIKEAGLSGVRMLTEFYSCCDGLWLPDIYNGYRINTLERTTTFYPDSDPCIVRLEYDVPVVHLGSTCGGDLFVVCKDNGNVLFLPHGCIDDGIYISQQSPVQVVGESIGDFIARLVSDTYAFVHGDPSHVYIGQTIV